MYLKKELYSLIKSNENIFDFIQNNSFDGLSYWDLENPENKWMNTRFWTVLGYLPDEMPHKSTAWQGIINQDDLKLASDTCNRYAENPNHPFDQMIRYTRKDGSIVRMLCRGLAIRDKEGKPIRMLGTHQEVSDIKNRELELIKANQKVHESEAKLNTLFTSMSEMMVMNELVFDENGKPVNYRITDCNKAFTKITGITRKNAMGRLSTEVYRTATPPYLKEFTGVALTGEPQHYESYFQPLDKSLSISVISLGNNHFATVTKDITASRQSEEILRESEENLSITLHSIGDGVITTDKFGMIDRMNPVALKLCGWNEDEIKGKPLTQVFSIINAITRKPVPNPVEKVIENGEIVGLANHTVLVAKNGKEYQIADSAAPIRDKSGNIKGVVLVFSDVSEKYAAEDALKRKSENLAKLLRASWILNESINKKTVLQKIVDTAVELTQMDSCAIYMIEENNLYMSATQPVFSANYPDEFRWSKLDDHWHINQTVQTKEIVILQDALKEKLSEQEEVIVKAIGFKTLLYLPLIHENSVLGVLILGTISRLHQFSDEELSLCKTFSNLSSTALANAKLFDENMQSVEKLKLLNRAVEASSVSIVITNAEGNIQYVNPWFSEITGYSSEEVVGKNPRVLNSGNHPKIFYEDLWNTILSGKDWTGELLNRKKNGELCWEKAIISPILNSDGVVTSFVAIKEDITERKKMLEELIAAKEKAEESEIQIRYSQEVARIGYYIFNIQTGFWSSSEMLDNIFGIDISYVRDVQGWLNLIHPDFQQEMLSYLSVNILKNRERFNKSYQIVNKKTNIACWVHGFGTLEFDNSGNLLKMFGTIQDISISKNSEQEIVQAKEKAEESDRLKSAFLANMSHEIRTPMNGILGFAELLREPGLTGEMQQKYIEIIGKSGKRMLNIINDIVDISKIEAGLMTLDIKESDINEQIEYAYTFFKPEAEAKGIKLSFKNTLPRKEAIIKTDSEKLYAILTNLVKNAIKYTKAGSIEFGYKMAETQSNASLQFYVKDTGIGIPKNRQEAIFERFIQADIADKMAYQGAGLGLTISKAYVEMLGGKIWVESEEGIGSTIYFTLPYNAQPAKETIVWQTTPSEKKENFRKLKILIAEDDEVSEMLIDSYIKMVGKEILKARTGIEAVEICRDNPDTDLILMDIRMPDMGGYEATRQIRQFNKEVVIIAQTAHGLTGDKEKAIEAGCNDYIAKPIKKSELLQVLQKNLQ